MRFVAGLFIISVLGVPAFAAEGGGSVREACKADVTTLCQGIQPGGGRIKACLKSNKDKLSPTCKSAIAAMAQARRAAKAASQQPTAPSTQAAPPVTSPVVP